MKTLFKDTGILPEDATFTYGKAYSKLLAKDGVTLE
jgi:hypothetical protein